MNRPKHDRIRRWQPDGDTNTSTIRAAWRAGWVDPQESRVLEEDERYFLKQLSLLFISSGRTNGSFAAGDDALFTAKKERCFPETAFGFVCLPSAMLSALQEVRRVHGDPGGVFITTR